MEENQKPQPTAPPPSNLQPPTPPPVKSSNTFLLVIVFILLLVIAGGAAWYFFLKSSVTQPASITQISPTPIVVSPTSQVPVASTSSTPSIAVAGCAMPTFAPSSNPNIKRFISKKNCITFTYEEKQDIETAAVSEQDNKIYIYSTRLNKPTEGQSIEVIKKDPQDNLKQAINKQILKGYSAADCILLPHKLSFLPASFTAVSMDVPRAADEEFDLSIAEQKAEKCPKYIGINGLEYFLEDTKHPDRMFFLRIGQYGITADSSDPNNIKAWQDTIEVY